MEGDGVKDWTVTVVPARLHLREKGLYLRARRRVRGREVELRSATGSDDPARAEQGRLVWLGVLNQPDALGLLGAMDARITDMAADPLKSQESVEAFKVARKKLAEAIGDLKTIDRPTLLRARDALKASIESETINTYMRRAAASWRWAEERGLVAGPWPRLKALPKPPRKKRPFTPLEVEAVLSWSLTYLGGRWAAPLHLIAETGRRVTEVCRLKGRDLDRVERIVRVRRKGGEPLVLPVSTEALALVPERAPDEWLFPASRERRLGSGRVPIRRESVLCVVNRALEVLKFADPERLDVHSFRRAFVSHAARAGLPDDVARRLTGHETPAMLAHYQRDTVGDDLRAAAERVRDYRAEACLPKPPRNSTTQNETSPAQGGAGNGAMRIRISDLVLISSSEGGGQSPPGTASKAGDPGEAARRSAEKSGYASPQRFTAPADEDERALFMFAGRRPGAVRRLLTDPEFQAQLLAALDDLAPAPSLHAPVAAPAPTRRAGG